MKRYIVFERCVGTQSWTIAHKAVPPIRNLPEHLKQFETDRETMVPAVFHLQEKAEDFVAEVKQTHRGWWAGIPDQRPMEACVACVDLPD